MRYYTSREACVILGVHENTLRKWEREEKIKCIRTQGGHRRYDLSDYLPFLTQNKSVICYCRVTSSKQKEMLCQQVKFMEERFPGCEIVKDIGSGLSFKRHGLRSILERSMQGERIRVVVAYKDRLARFGAELIEWIIKLNGGEVVALNEISFSPKQELIHDLLTVLHVFSCRLNGLRKYREIIKMDTHLYDGEAEGTA